MNPSTLILYRDRKGRYRWSLKAPNGNKIAREAHGPGYARAINRNNGIRSVLYAFGLRQSTTVEWPKPGRTCLAVEKAGVKRLIIRNDD